MADIISQETFEVFSAPMKMTIIYKRPRENELQLFVVLDKKVYGKFCTSKRDCCIRSELIKSIFLGTRDLTIVHAGGQTKLSLQKNIVAK